MYRKPRTKYLKMTKFVYCFKLPKIDTEHAFLAMIDSCQHPIATIAHNWLRGLATGQLSPAHHFKAD